MNMSPLIDHMIRAGKLDIELYREVKADPASLDLAVKVVFLSSVAAGIGSLDLGWSGFFLGTIAAFAGWFFWALIIYLVGARLLPEPQTRSSLGELLRVTAFASAPGVIRILAGIPYLKGVVILVASIWILVAMMMATRQAFDYQSGWRTAGVCLLGWIVQGMLIAPFLIRMSPDGGQ
jgi:hypothetical protein